MPAYIIGVVAVIAAWLPVHGQDHFCCGCRGAGLVTYNSHDGVCVDRENEPVPGCADAKPFTAKHFTVDHGLLTPECYNLDKWCCDLAMLDLEEGLGKMGFFPFPNAADVTLAKGALSEIEVGVDFPEVPAFGRYALTDTTLMTYLHKKFPDNVKVAAWVKERQERDESNAQSQAEADKRMADSLKRQEEEEKAMATVAADEQAARQEDKPTVLVDPNSNHKSKKEGTKEHHAHPCKRRARAAIATITSLLKRILRKMAATKRTA